MTAKDIMIARTGCDSDVAAIYIKIAIQRLRLYLRYTEDDDIEPFSDVIATIAMYLRKMDQDQAHISETIGAGVTSQSFSEGGVSVKKEYESIGDNITQYENLIADALETLKDYRKMGEIQFI